MWWTVILVLLRRLSFLRTGADSAVRTGAEGAVRTIRGSILGPAVLFSLFQFGLLTDAHCAEPAITKPIDPARTWKAGVAKRVITPEKGVWLAGYGSKRAPDGKLHDLWMKALSLIHI